MLGFKSLAPIIKTALKRKKMNYRDLADELNMSEANVKKQMTADDCSLNRLSKICQLLDLRMSELFALVEKPDFSVPELTIEQQKLLVSNSRILLYYFKKSAELGSDEKIKEELRLTARESEKIVRQLCKVDLLVEKENGEIAVNKKYVGVWGQKGPLNEVMLNDWGVKLYKSLAARAFEKDTLFAIRYFRLSNKSTAEFNQDFIALLQKYDTRSRSDSVLADSLNDRCLLMGATTKKLSTIISEPDFK